MPDDKPHRGAHRVQPINPAVMALWLRAAEHPYGIAIPCGSEQDRFTLAYQLKTNREKAGEDRYFGYNVILPAGSNEVWLVLKPPEETETVVTDE